jgi:cytochrome c5|tara:strand:- start:762 stop:1190 length:429 start_codon:yes stop_codon:yes gene_type:complete
VKRELTSLILAAGLLTAATAQAYQQEEDLMTKDAIEQRIKPIGEVYDADNVPQPVVTATSSGARSGEQVYNSACGTCHGAGVAGAPKFGDAAGWADRIAKGNDTLYTHAIQGFNGMPAKGMCFDCSDDELKAAVDYIVENSQ